jgi:hypothetical protein
MTNPDAHYHDLAKFVLTHVEIVAKNPAHKEEAKLATEMLRKAADEPRWLQVAAEWLQECEASLMVELLAKMIPQEPDAPKKAA